MERIDSYPTHHYGGYKLRKGRPVPFGATYVPGGVNFSIFSHHATACTLVLFEKEHPEPIVEIPFPVEFRVGDMFTMVVFDLDYETLEYGFRMDGPYDPEAGHYFDSSIILLDPYGKAVSGRNIWAQIPDMETTYPYRSRTILDDFDWQHDHQLQIPIEDLIIYEMHVRSFTKHPSSEVKYPGTFAAIRDKIPYLLELGVNCIELMPVFEFDELENHRINPETGEPLVNYWGYSTIGFFAPKAGYAATGWLGMQADEFKMLVKELHRHGIEIILDVVFNHTGEGNDKGTTFSFRGIDNKTYYMLAPDGSYLNFSGTGNTMNCNHPVVRSLVLHCLRHWVAEYHIDGFRFDLASILGRDQDGEPLANPPLLEILAYDPVLADCKLIAEAWDAGGLYQVGTFPAYGRWAEWNGKYRDAIRRFIKSDRGLAREVAQRIQGSPDLYPQRGPTASINFITAHDGFTLHDLVSYSEKHNLANGENNRDGTNDNLSWNCGVEGPTDNPEINTLRRRLMKNALAILMVSQGVPMILMGDDMGRTKRGNNNTYCHDNELNWLDWTLLEENVDLFRFFKNMIAFRKVHQLLRQREYFHVEKCERDEVAGFSWHGVRAWQPAWGETLTLAFMVCDEDNEKGKTIRDHVYVAMNMHWENHDFELPELSDGMRWHIFVDTSAPYPDDICEPGEEMLLDDQEQYLMGARSVVVLVGKSID